VRTFEDLRAETLALLSQLSDIARARGAEEAVARLSASQRHLLEERLLVVACGEFKRGKSSLLNALLEDPGLFPVDSFDATNMITMASYSATERITVNLVSADGNLVETEIPRSEIAGYATESGNPGNTKQVQLITIETPNPRLAHGLTLVDTPGIGGIYDQHSAITLGFLESASALLFVTDATQPLLQSELDFIRQAAESARMTDDTDGLVVALTKIDAVADFDEIAANTRAKLAEATGRPPGATPLVPVSARCKLDYLRNGFTEYLNLSNCAELEQVLWAALARRKTRALLSAALADLDRTAHALLIPIEVEARALSGEDRELITLAVQMQDRAAWFASLRDHSEQWRADLAGKLHAVRDELQQRGQQELGMVWDQCQAVYLHNDRYLTAPDLLLSQVIADAASTFSAISELASRATARAVKEFSLQHGLELQRPEVARLPDPPLLLSQLSAELSETERPVSGSRTWTQAADGVKSVGTASAGVGMVAGAVIGSMVPVLGTAVGANVGWVAGFVIGSSVGAVSGYRDAAREAKDKGVRMRGDLLWAKLQPLRRSQQMHLGEALDDLVHGYISAATQELDSRVVQEHEGVAEALARLQALRDGAERAAGLRRCELTGERAPLDQILARVGALAEAAARLVGALPEELDSTSTTVVDDAG
jgi:GTP-binding protein EngB required for normal cell division